MSAATQTASPLSKLMVFAKLYDVAPDGSRTLVKDLVAAARIPDITEPARIALPGVVHRFAPGHRVQLVLACLLLISTVIGVTRLVLGIGEPIGTFVNVAWVVFDLVVLSVLIPAARFRGFVPNSQEVSA